MKILYGWIFLRFVFLAVVIVTRGGFCFGVRVKMEFDLVVYLLKWLFHYLVST